MNCLGHKVIFGSTEDGMKSFEIKKKIEEFKKKKSYIKHYRYLHRQKMELNRENLNDKEFKKWLWVHFDKRRKPTESN